MDSILVIAAFDVVVVVVVVVGVGTPILHLMHQRTTMTMMRQTT